MPIVKALPDTPPGIEEKANKILNDLVVALDPIQKNYFEKNKKFWQGIKTPVITPKDGAKIAPDKSKEPTDQAENWTDVAVPLPLIMEISTAVDVYDGPQGWGYIAKGEIELAGNTWIKAINIGPEKYREHDWIKRTNILKDAVPKPFILKALEVPKSWFRKVYDWIKGLFTRD